MLQTIIFDAIEIPVWKQAIKDLEDSKKSNQNMEEHAREEERAMNNGKETKLLLSIGLEKFLLWHSVKNK